MRLSTLFEKQLDTKLKYHKTLNPKLWDEDKLKLEPKLALKQIAKKFIEYLKIEASAVTDVILTGSICNYNWSELSDIDLHVVVDYDVFCVECKHFDLTDCMKAKKSLWNEQHEITIYGHDVELYVQASDDPITGNAGVYSLQDGKWLQEPQYEDIEYDEKSISNKAEIIANSIDELINSKSDNIKAFDQIQDRIRKMRKIGLENEGEFSLENLAFKTLRNNGYFDKMNAYVKEIENSSLSLP